MKEPQLSEERSATRAKACQFCATGTVKGNRLFCSVLCRNRAKGRAKRTVDQPDASYSFIPLTKQMVAIVDAADYERAAQYNWQAIKGRKTWYAARMIVVDGRQINQLMHVFLMQPPDGQVVDHKDGDGLNNTRANLRVATFTQNQVNRGPTAANTSGYKGVYRDGKRWRALVKFGGKAYSVGSFNTAEQAARAYDAAALRIQGEFAWQNFPKENNVQ